MKLTNENIAKNARKFYETIEKYGFSNDTLIELLGEDFIKAPASTKDDFNNAFEGGLIAHLLTVAKYAVKINGILPDNLKVDTTSLLKVALLHQIGKAKLFVPITSKWHLDRGINYEFNNDLVSLSAGERSIYYLTEAKIGLNEEEYQAILNYDKEGDKQAQYHTSTLGVILRQANELAIIEETTI